jgi:hypothetical protein
MGQDQHIIDERGRFERLCLELAEDSSMPEERAGLLEMAGNYAAARPQVWTQTRKYGTEPDVSSTRSAPHPLCRGYVTRSCRNVS